MGFIYKITSPSNKNYIGQTYDLTKRIAAHKCATKYGKNIILHNSIRKYGWAAHTFEVIEEVEDSMMDSREVFWIAELKTFCLYNDDGMNMTEGGKGHRSTWMHKVELRKWFSEKFTGEGNPFYGKKHTEETRKILSDNAKVRNLKEGRRIPEWGAEKGRQIVRRPIVCYNLTGEFIKEYNCARMAAIELGLKSNNICDNCNNKSTNCGGYIFKYKTDNYPLKIQVGEIKTQTVKRPVLTLVDFEVICEHPSAQEASDFWGIPKTTINRAAQYNWLVPIRSGHVFIYTDLYAEIEALTA